MTNSRKIKTEEKLNQAFGNPKDDSFDFEQIENYFRKKDHSGAFQVLSDKTCNDLDFQEVFMFIDRTTSNVGQQYFYNKLRIIPQNSQENIANERLIDAFSNDTDFRLFVQQLLSKLNTFETYYISQLFQDDHLAPPKWYAVVKFLSVASLFSLVGLLFIPKLFVVLLSIFIANMIVHYWNKRNLYNYFSSIPRLLTLNKVARTLFQQPLLHEVNPELLKSIREIDSVRNRMSCFNLDVKFQTDAQVVFWTVLEFFKILFLLEPLLLFGTLRQLDTKRKEIEDVFVFVGQIDSMLSIASLRNGLDRFCSPKIIPQPKTMWIKEGYHPLIAGCVTNTITVDGRSILLTGSNMSGKTSFIRMVGINVITGLTINTCFADHFSMPRMRVYSAIRISDDLLNDKSYYFEEVLTIKDMLDRSREETPNLLLLDEIFKGTNTVERISAGKAVLSYMTKADNIVFVSTHDIELAELLKSEYELYHFSEKVDYKSVDFDYLLKPGRLKNRNAIRILQINEYPATVIDEAIELSKELDKIRELKMV